MRGRTYHAIFSILYGLGLRVGEACRLRIRDVDFDRRLLVIRRTKFYKSRLVPFGPRMEGLLLSIRNGGVTVATASPSAVGIDEVSSLLSIGGDRPIYMFENNPG